MVDFLSVCALLLMPFFLNKLEAFRKGLITGLMVSLFYWSNFIPLLGIIPLFASFCLFFTSKKDSLHYPKNNLLISKHPALPLLLIFVTSMAIFSALDDSFASYGNYIGLGARVLGKSSDINKIAFIVGPIFIGNACDKKGPFATSIMLTLIGEASVLFASKGDVSNPMFYFGCFFIHFTTSGFYVLLPRIIEAFFGQRNFTKIYPIICVIVLGSWLFAEYVYTKNRLGTNPGDFLILLLILTVISSFFIFIAWKRRFILVMDKRCKI